MVRPQTFVFLGLNAARFLSIVSLLLVFSSTIVVMVNNIKAVNRFQANRIANSGSNSTELMLDCDYIQGSTVPNQPAGVFWAVVAGLLIIFQVVILLFSEIGWPAIFFDKFFPVLGADFGLGALGIFQCLIGAQILSHHVDDFTLVAAFFLFSIGCLNMFLGLIFREGAKAKRSTRAKRAAGKGGIIANPSDIGPPFVRASPHAVSNIYTGASEKSVSEEFFATWKSTDKANYGFGRQGEKAAGLRGFMIQRPEESLPRYASPTPTFAAPREEQPSRAASPQSQREVSPPPRGPRRGSPSPVRSASSRSASSRSSSAASSDRSSTSSFGTPIPYRQTIEIPDSPNPETPPPFHASSPSRYGRNPSAF